MTSFTKYFGACCLAAIGGIAVAGQAVRQLIVDGNTASMNVVQANGQYEVPVNDVAKYFGYTVTINGTQATLTKIPAATGTVADTNVLASQTTSGSTTTTTTSTGTPMPPPSPTSIAVAVGSSASANGFDYTVTSIQDVGSSYKDMFDQRASSLHPRWKTDSLIVVEVSVTNRAANPVPAIIPGPANITVFDSKRIGYQATAIDQRQSSDAITSGSDDYSSTYGTGSNLILGPGGTLHFAAIASVPKGDRVTSVMLRLGAGANDGSGLTGAIVTVTRS